MSITRKSHLNLYIMSSWIYVSMRQILSPLSIIIRSLSIILFSSIEKNK